MSKDPARLLAKLQQLEKEVASNEGYLQAQLAQLAEFGADSIESAKEILAQWGARLDQLENKIAARRQKFLDKWSNKLEG